MIRPIGALAANPCRVRRVGVAAAWLAGACVAATLAWGSAGSGAGAGWPLALHAASGQAHAAAFGACAFVLPGLAWAVAAGCWRRALGEAMPWPLRLAAQLALLAALGWLAQGIWPLDPDNLDGPAGQYHALAWTAWWLAGGGAGGLAGVGFWRLRRRAAAGLAWVLAAMLWLAVHAAPAPLAPAVAEALAVVVWSLAMLLAWRAPLAPPAQP